DHLDDLDLLVAGRLQHDRELGLLFGRGGGGTGSRAGGHGDRGGGGNAELLFESLDQLHHLDEGLAADGFQDFFVGKGHCDLPQWNCVFGNSLIVSIVPNGGSTGTSGGLLLADRVDHAAGLHGGFRQHAGQHGRRLRDEAHQHGQCLLAGRQRRQDIHVGARVLLPTQRNQARPQLVGGLGEVLDETAGGAGVFLREGEQQRAGQLVLDDGIVGPFHRARDQRVLGNLRNTPAWRAFLRKSVNCSTVRPAYSAATSECALEATSASSATTSFFWFR